eukprot:TRINITY_DN9420_c0_g1_i1.p1 TRINITY_DN9420_c0_g1~~TRINITY_DN9420_c0_g1_i1.p1  ORF type:complete len:100 (-),score=5.89 TRINITY_DN9420_c0_g1_i1:274-573(-)
MTSPHPVSTLTIAITSPITTTTTITIATESSNFWCVDAVVLCTLREGGLILYNRRAAERWLVLCFDAVCFLLQLQHQLFVPLMHCWVVGLWCTCVIYLV